LPVRGYRHLVLLLRPPAVLCARTGRRPGGRTRRGDRLRRQQRQRRPGRAAPAFRGVRAHPGAPVVEGRGDQPLSAAGRGPGLRRVAAGAALTGGGGAWLVRIRVRTHGIPVISSPDSIRGRDPPFRRSLAWAWEPETSNAKPYQSA